MSRRGLSVSPLVVGTTIYMAQIEENLGSTCRGMLNAFRGIGKSDITQDAPIWKKPWHHGGKELADVGRWPAVRIGRPKQFLVVEAATGKSDRQGQVVRRDRPRQAPCSPMGKIYLCSTTAWHVFQPDGGGA